MVTTASMMATQPTISGISPARDKSAREHAHADLHHRRAMEVGGNGRRRLHGRGQPHVQREPGRTWPRRRTARAAARRPSCSASRPADRANARTCRYPANRKAAPRCRVPERTDMRDDQRLHAGLLGRGRHVVADEAPGAHAGDLEEHELARRGSSCTRDRPWRR